MRRPRLLQRRVSAPRGVRPAEFVL